MAVPYHTSWYPTIPGVPLTPEATSDPGGDVRSATSIALVLLLVIIIAAAAVQLSRSAAL